MTFLSWFTGKPAPSKPRMAEPSGLLHADATVPLVTGRDGKPVLSPNPADHAANRVNERMERRELLYMVVRDAMVRAGVLSAGYKFKVLSLDQRGRQFLIMIDLAEEYVGETVHLSEIETLIAQTAKTRYDVTVSSVYWRVSDHVSIGMPHTIPPTTAAVPLSPAATAAKTAPLRPPVHPRPHPHPQPQPQQPPPALVPTPVPATPIPAGTAPTAPRPLAAKPPPRFEPIEADEVAAFKRALASAAATRSTATAVPLGVSVHSGPLRDPASGLGFADTEMPEDNRPPDLGATQYGELR